MFTCGASVARSASSGDAGSLGTGCRKSAAASSMRSGSPLPGALGCSVRWGSGSGGSPPSRVSSPRTAGSTAEASAAGQVVGEGGGAAAAGQPSPSWPQHHVFFSSDQPASQLVRPSRQSYRASAAGKGTTAGGAPAPAAGRGRESAPARGLPSRAWITACCWRQTGMVPKRLSPSGMGSARPRSRSDAAESSSASQLKFPQ
mmetsp:Transcript_29878/g.79209  ORF Transcript_29878/g.79209 Transcript_29878/m.79209 type:complete len:202 (-) Transcript_29878:856-1461(-)